MEDELVDGSGEQAGVDGHLHLQLVRNFLRLILGAVFRHFIVNFFIVWAKNCDGC